jgi:hypothetical protein
MWLGYGKQQMNKDVEEKSKVATVLNELSTAPLIRMGKLIYRSTFSSPRH